VQEAAVVARPDEQQLSRTVACIVVRDGFEPTAALARELQAFVESRLASFKRPHLVEFHTALPKTATGKLQRFRLR
jgi:acyl-coenzyme A synthetase/AMP-(fatty) acid ligase